MRLIRPETKDQLTVENLRFLSLQTLRHLKAEATGAGEAEVRENARLAIILVQRKNLRLNRVLRRERSWATLDAVNR